MDITLCTQQLCTRRKSCYRALAKASPFSQSMSEFVGGDRCEYYLPAIKILRASLVEVLDTPARKGRRKGKRKPARRMRP